MVKEFDEYVDIISERYPSVPKKDLYKILQHGFVKLFEINRLGSDVYISNTNYSALFGKKFKDHKARTKHQRFMQVKKLHMQYNYKLTDFDGKYYFGVNEEQFKLLKRGQGNVAASGIKFFKIKEECFMNKHNTHFFILYYPIDLGWKFTKDKINKRNFEYFAYRDDNNKIVEINGKKD